MLDPSLLSVFLSFFAEGVFFADDFREGFVVHVEVRGVLSAFELSQVHFAFGVGQQAEFELAEFGAVV